MATPEEDYDYYEEENFDHFMEDEEALEALREVEQTKSPAKKRMKLESNNLPVAINEQTTKTLKDITNRDEDYRIPCLGERKVYRRVPLDGDYQTLTHSDGDRFYLRFKSQDSEEFAKDPMEALKSSKGFSGLLDYKNLLEAAVTEQIRMQAIVSSEDENPSLSMDLSEEDSGVDSALSEEEGGAGNSSKSLWVDKFRPKSYLQLLSDEATNRTLLKWLKLWDKVVFGKDSSAAAAATVKNDDKTSKVNSVFELDEELDETHRPQQKTALLYGPPGLGKTTLAYVVANHAGYRPIEINASDDRSLAAFKVKLESATQMKSVSNADQRPNCLVIDEIDGAPAATINFLINLMTTGKVKGKKAKNKDILQRPVICICNDLYAPALRPLRRLSLLLKFPPTCSQRLVQRLTMISAHERLKTDHTALSALAEKSENDIRSCLSTLQFFKSKGTKMSAVDVYKTFVGQKDSTKSHFSVWQDLFQTPRQLNKRKFVDAATSSRDDKSDMKRTQIQQILRTVQACGDYRKLQEGVFENYLDVKFKDSRFQTVNRGLQWFVFFDCINQHIQQSQNYSAMSYLPYNFVATHCLFSASPRVKITYPTKAKDMTSQLQKNDQIVQSLFVDMAPAVRCYTTATSMIRDTIPCLMQICQPPLRPVNTQLFTATEKLLLQNVIAIFISYSMNFVQERSTEGGGNQYLYKFDPNVEEVVYFKLDSNQHIQLPYAIKQLIAHEVDKEKMRRGGGGGDAVNTNRAPQATVQNNEDKEGEVQVPSHLRQKLEAKQVVVKEHVPVDFFGRKIVTKVDPAKEAAKKENEIIISDVWFKFKEGYNNAVRRNIRMKDLF